jgi:hypothetical protein
LAAAPAKPEIATTVKNARNGFFMEISYRNHTSPT